MFDHGIIAAGPITQPRGMMPHRIVLRVKRDGAGVPTEFIVQTQAFNDDGTHNSFAHGHYFSSRGGKDIGKCLHEAFNRWQKKVRDNLINPDGSLSLVLDFGGEEVYSG